MPDAATDSPVHIEELPASGMIDLRLRVPDGAEGKRCLASLEAALGVALPTEPRRAGGETPGDAPLQALWMAPDQWLLLCAAENVAETLDSLAQAREKIGGNLMATDMSSARCVIRLRGDGTRAVLMKAIAVDFLPPAFMPGHLRRCSFAGIAAMVHCRSAAPDEFDLYVFRSYAEFVLAWLHRSAMPAAQVELFRDNGQPASE